MYMKVIQITDHMGSGGVNSFVYDLCLAQVQAGLEVTFIGLIDSKDRTAAAELEKMKNAGVEVVCLGASGKRDAIIHHVLSLRRHIQKIAGNDRCICNLHLKLSVLCGVLATFGLKNVKCVETYHNTYRHYELQYALCYPLIKHYIAISKTCGEEMKRRFHTPEQKMTVIPNGINREQVRVLAQIEKVIPHSGIQLISVGRMSYEKNLEKPVEALADICSEDLRYCVIGNGPQQNDILSAAKGNKYIEFTGWLPRTTVLNKLAQADIVIMPSLWEGRSILQLEAMALDKPMIISDVPALREVFKERALEEDEVCRICRWGCLVKTNNPDAYRRAVEILCRQPISWWKEASLAVQQRSCETDMVLTVRGYKKVYENLLW